MFDETKGDVVVPARGERTIVRWADGLCAAALTLPNGKRKWFYAKTQREVRQKLNDAKAAVARGQDLLAGKQTVEQFLTHWIETIRSTVRPNTALRYRRLLNTHIIPEIGSIRLSALNGQILAALYQRKQEQGSDPRHVCLMHVVLHRAFRDAVRWGLLETNPCDRVDPPRWVVKPKRTLTPSEVRRFLAVAREDALYPLWLLAVTTGMRQGELLALHWEDVDLDLGRIHVCRTLSKGEHGFLEMPPKTAKGRRVVSLLPEAVEALKAHWERREEVKANAGDEWQENDLVFHSQTGRYLNVSHVGSVRFRRLLERAKCPVIPFHNLRHSAATLLLSLGVHPRVVGDLLGHSSITVTVDIYSHATQSLQEEAVEKLGALLFGTDGHEVL